MTTHPDQHSIAFDNGRVYVANDGGLYRRPLRGETNANGNATDRENLNANIRTLQYYSVAVGMVPGVVAVSGGLQDNGGSTWSRLGGNLPYTSALDVHLGPDNRIHAATHGRGIGRSQSRKRTTLSGLPCDRIPTPLHGCGGWMKICVQNWSGTIVAFSPVKEP